MNVASLELSKTLFELSGWQPDEWHKVVADGKVLEHVEYPVYHLGYLLRKLPAMVEPPKSKRYFDLVGKKFGEKEVVYGYYYQYDSYDTGLLDYIGFEADTPEDAACKLAIELFKQGVLTNSREGGKENV